jgi:hypothetical protein
VEKKEETHVQKKKDKGKGIKKSDEIDKAILMHQEEETIKSMLRLFMSLLHLTSRHSKD